jgi:hypothetical protein
MKELAFIVVILLLVALVMSWIISSDTAYINKYCDERNYKVVSIERYVFSTGPFSVWTSDETRIYKVVTNRKVVWFRFGWWIETIEE